MKKYLISLFTIFCALCTQAQGFQPEIRATYELGVDNDKNQSFGVEFIAGYRITPLFRLGAGVGINYIDLLYEKEGLIFIGHDPYFNNEYRESAASIPIFANAKINFIDNKVSPFFTADAGYNVYIACSKYAEKNKLGFFISPAFGTDFKIGDRGAITLKLGYKYQIRKCDQWEKPNGNYSQITFSAGYQF